MSIVFLILKIIGILLLVILCLILLVLFHPIFYQVEGEAEEKISLQGYFWWLFQILRLEFQWEDQEFNLRLRIFGFSRNLGEEETEEDFAESAMDDSEYGREASEEEEESVAEEKNPTEEFVAEGEKIPLERSALEEAECQTVEVATEENKSQKEDKAGKKKQDNQIQDSGSKKASGSPKKKKQKAKTDKKEKKGNRKGKIQDRFKKIRHEVSDERNHQAISHLWRELCYLLTHLKPKYVKAEISFSTGDPALTGKVTGALSLFPLIYRYDAHIYPDFLSEEFYIKGSLKMKGHITVFHLLIILIRLFFDKNIRRLYNKFK